MTSCQQIEEVGEGSTYWSKWPVRGGGGVVDNCNGCGLSVFATLTYEQTHTLRERERKTMTIGLRCLKSRGRDWHPSNGDLIDHLAPSDREGGGVRISSHTSSHVTSDVVTRLL